MANFEIQRNIARFEMLLRDPMLEPLQRRTIERLLSEERQKRLKPESASA